VPIEDADAFVILAEAELLAREHHALTLDPAHRLPAEDRTLSGVTVDDLGTLVGVRHDRAFDEVGRTRDDGLRSTLAVIHRGEKELVGIGMLGELRDATDAHLLAPPGPFDALHFGAAGAPKITQTAAHQNCSRYRTSF